MPSKICTKFGIRTILLHVIEYTDILAGLEEVLEEELGSDEVAPFVLLDMAQAGSPVVYATGHFKDLIGRCYACGIHGCCMHVEFCARLNQEPPLLYLEGLSSTCSDNVELHVVS
jgi:hypothetical protein